VSRSVEQYLNACPGDAREMLEQIREMALDVVPDATETISYQVPALRFEGRILIWYAAFARHVSLFPASDAVQRSVGAALTPYLAGRGTIRFPKGKPLPEELIRNVVRARIEENRRRSDSPRRTPDRP